MSTGSHQLYPGQRLGGFTLGAHLKDVLDRVKSQAHETQQPLVNLAYSSSDPTITPVLITLPNEGIRLRFNGPEQKLRLIEVLDFAKAAVTYSGHEVFKSCEDVNTSGVGTPKGPTHRMLSKLFGPTYPGEYLPPSTSQGSTQGQYVLSYPGVAFSFAIDAKKWSTDADTISSLLQSPATVATSMAIFEGRSWAESRNRLYDLSKISSRPQTLDQFDSFEPSEDFGAVKILGEGRIELVRRSGPSFWITLSETTPQDLVTELGPPDAIYRKNDRRLAIHRKDGSSNQMPTDRTSALQDESDDDNPAMSEDAREIASSEHFYNYFRLGIDILISQPTATSMASPTVPESQTFYAARPTHFPRNHLTATKVLLHGNVPGAWNFNRYRRCRWSLEHVPTAADTDPLTSETKFTGVSERLKEVFSSASASPEETHTQQRGMLLNRGWGASPDSSCELLGGWEEGMHQELRINGNAVPDGLETTSELFGYPGMVFEVLKSGAINCLTVY